MRSTPWSRAISTAPASPRRRPMHAVARGDASAAAARPADRHQGPGGNRGPAHHLSAARSSATTFRPRTNASSPASRAAGAIVIGKTNTPEFGAGANTRNAVYGATGNPFDPANPPPVRPAGRRWRWRPAWRRSAPAPTPAARCAIRPRSAASSASGRRRAWCRPRSAPSAGQPAGARADGAHRPGCLPAAVGHASDDVRDPLATTVHGQNVRGAGRFHPLPAGSTCRGCAWRSPRISASRPTERHIARGLRREDRGCSATSSPAPRMPRRIAPAPTRRSRCCARWRSCPPMRRRCATRPQDVGPNVRANVDEGLRYTAPTSPARWRCRPRSIAAGRTSSQHTT